MKHLPRGFCFTRLALIVAAVATIAHAEAPVVRFGVQPWPGVTIKTEIASQILETLGYRTQQTQLNTPLTLHGLASGELDVNLGGWYPISAGMIQPMVDKGKVVRLTANLSGALSGLAVPLYVHEAGVDSIDDLQRYADRFDSTIYGIETGSTWNSQVVDVIKTNRHGLGSWTMLPSSTAAMLAQVDRATSRKDWIVFYGWTPHWMNVSYDLYYLQAPEDSPIADTEATVYTLVPSGFSEKRPNLARFFKQYAVDAKTQSKWIYDYGYAQRPAEAVAREWIA